MKKSLTRFACALLAFLMIVPLWGCNGGTPAETTDPADNITSEEIPEETEEQLQPILTADLANYTLIRPEKLSDDVLDQINVLFQKLKKEYGISEYKDDFYREDVPMYAIGEYEIIVGNTNRPETAAFLSELKYNDYGYALIGKKIVIAGHSDAATINAIEEFIMNVLLDKNKEEGVFYSSEYDFLQRLDYTIGSLFVGDISIKEYKIVYPKKNSNSEKIAAQMIADAIAEASGIVINVADDGEEASEYEILVGATNRNTDDEIAAMSAGLGSTEAIIKYDGKKIAVFGTTSTAILVASNELVSKLKTDKTEKLTVSLESELLCKYDDSILTAMSFNVWVSGKTVERNERVLTMVRNYFPDTIGFQEVDPVWLATLNAGLKDQYACVGEGRDGGTSGEYNPIFYKKEIFNLIDSGTRWLSDTPEKVSKFEESSLNRIYTYALLEKKSDGTRIMVVNTHFDHKSAVAREKQAAVLVKFLESVTDYPIVLTGDFNCEASSSAYSTIVSSVVSDSSTLADKRINKAATFTNYGSSNKIIDFVFVSPKGVAVSSYKVCNEAINGDFPSDHHPVLIEYTALN